MVHHLLGIQSRQVPSFTKKPGTSRFHIYFKSRSRQVPYHTWNSETDMFHHLLESQRQTCSINYLKVRGRQVLSLTWKSEEDRFHPSLTLKPGMDTDRLYPILESQRQTGFLTYLYPYQTGSIHSLESEGETGSIPAAELSGRAARRRSAACLVGPVRTVRDTVTVELERDTVAAPAVPLRPSTTKLCHNIKNCMYVTA